MKVIRSASIIAKITDLDDKIKKLTSEKAEYLKSVVSQNENDPQLVVCAENEDGTWGRVTVTDNKELIDEGFYKPVKVERFSTKVETLKNKPKELA